MSIDGIKINSKHFIKKIDNINENNRCIFIKYYKTELDRYRELRKSENYKIDPNGIDFGLARFKQKRKMIYEFLTQNEINSINLEDITQDILKQAYINFTSDRHRSWFKYIQELIECISKDLKYEIDINQIINSCEEEVPAWAEYGPSLDNATKEQRDFYNKWKECYMKNVCIDIHGQITYIFVYLYEVVEKFKNNKDISFIEYEFGKIRNMYGMYNYIIRYLDIWIVDSYLFIGDYDKAWDSLIKIDRENFMSLEKYISIQDILLIKNNCKNTHINSEEFLLICSKSQLTDFGRQNIDNLKYTMDIELKKFKDDRNKNVVDFLLNQINIENLTDRDFSILEEWYINEDEFKELKCHYINIYSKKSKCRGVYRKSVFLNVPKSRDTVKYLECPQIPTMVLNGLKYKLIKLLREFENIYRESIGGSRIGEGWISETNLYYQIKDYFNKLKVKQHKSPRWLGKQHFDIYMPNVNIAIEYQGEQHSKPVDIFGGLESYKNQLVRDKKKQDLAIKNKCNLIYVYPNYNIDEVISIINNIIDGKTTGYIHNNVEVDLDIELSNEVIIESKESKLDKKKREWTSMLGRFTDMNEDIINIQDNSSLYRWALDQKYKYILNKLGDEELEELINIGFNFDMTWDDMYYSLLNEKKLQKKIVRRIENWVELQKLAFMSNNLSKEESNKLIEAGIELQTRDDVYLDNYNIIKDKIVSSDKTVEELVELDSDVKRFIREESKIFKNGEFKIEDILKLYEIGIFFSSTDKIWYSNFNKLLLFKLEYGHCNVPRTYSRDKSLGEWVKTQRRRFKDGKLEKYRIELLESEGFLFRIN